MRYACKYNIIRFQPYAETEEFVSIGIVLYIPAYRKLFFKVLNTRQNERITHFFKKLDNNLFKYTVQIIQAELKRIQELLNHNSSDLYAELVRPREDIIRYSNNRVIFSTDPENTVNELFEYYVHHSFVHKKQHEEEIAKKIKELLQINNLSSQFKEISVGNDKYALRLPFVGKKQQIIKPIHFRHTKSTEIIEHGLVWLTKINQLQLYGYARLDTTLFAYKAPENTKSKLFEAFSDVRKQIEDSGIIMADIKKSDKITEFVINNSQ